MKDIFWGSRSVIDSKVSMRSFRSALCLLAVMVLCACAASGPAFQQSGVPDGKAVIYVYRNGSIVGAATEYVLFANDKYLTTIGNGGFYRLEINPGHVKFGYLPGFNKAFFIAHGVQEGLNKLLKDQSQCGEFDVEAGSEHFLRVKLHMAGMDLIEIPREKGLKEVASLHEFETPVPSNESR